MLHQFQCMKEGSLFYYQHGFHSPSGICPVCGHGKVRVTGRTFPDLDENSPLPVDDSSEDEEDGEPINPGPWNSDEGVFFEHSGQTFGPFRNEHEAEAALAEEQRATGRAI